MPEIGMILREGKGKKIYATDDPDKAIVYFKDEAMAFHGLKRGRILGKGEVNNSVCEHLFQLLKENGIENHYLERIDARHSLIRRCEMIPLSVKIRNRSAGQLAERTGIPVRSASCPAERLRTLTDSGIISHRLIRLCLASIRSR